MNDKRQGVLLEWMLDKIEKNGRVDGSSFFCVFECEVQVGTSTATTVACQRDDDAGTDVGAFGDESLGEVAIADGVISVPQGHILAGRLVLSHFDDHPLHHGQYLLAPCVQVDTAVKLPLSGKRVFPVAVW